MSIIRSVYNVFGTSAAIVILAGCGGGSQVFPAASQQQTVSQSSSTAPLFGYPPTLPFGGVSKTMQPNHQRSWMAPGAKSQTLLYVADYGNNDVDVLSYPKGKLVGTLAIDGGSEGVCVDKANDIWVTAVHTQQIFEYAHGGATPIATLSDPGYDPVGCAVNKHTGNLAVANIASYSGYQGSLSVYRKAKGTPAIYVDPNLYQYYFVSYDNMGNIFVDGLKSLGNDTLTFGFAEKPKGSKTFTDITLNQNINLPGGVQWDGTYMTVGDAYPSPIIYQTSGTNVVGSTPLSDAYHVLGYFIDKGRGKVVVPNLPQNLDGNIMYFNYPAGGYSTKSITLPTGPYGYPEPISVVVSK